MTRWLVVIGLLLWPGATLLLAELRWFSRPHLADRLRPYAPRTPATASRRSPLSVESFRDAVGPVSTLIGERIANLLGASEDVRLRLVRVHAPVDRTAFRVRQLGGALVGFTVGVLVAASGQPPLPIGLALVLGSPLCAFVLVEQRLAAASRAWQRRVFLELPIISEQVAMLLSAGYSLTAAINRVAHRGDGACAQDLRRVARRVRHGIGEVQALREWAQIARVPAVDRLVAVLALNRETGDLGRLLSEEARSIRRDAHRELTELVERRGQQVWIPVTVATLVPGVMFLSVPFIAALQVFAE